MDAQAVVALQLSPKEAQGEVRRRTPARVKVGDEEEGVEAASLALPAQHRAARRDDSPLAGGQKGGKLGSGDFQGVGVEVAEAVSVCDKSDEVTVAGPCPPEVDYDAEVAAASKGGGGNPVDGEKAAVAAGEHEARQAVEHCIAHPAGRAGVRLQPVQKLLRLGEGEEARGRRRRRGHLRRHYGTPMSRVVICPVTLSLMSTLGVAL